MEHVSVSKVDLNISYVPLIVGDVWGGDNNQGNNHVINIPSLSALMLLSFPTLVSAL